MNNEIPKLPYRHCANLRSLSKLFEIGIKRRRLVELSADFFIIGLNFSNNEIPVTFSSKCFLHILIIYRQASILFDLKFIMLRMMEMQNECLHQKLDNFLLETSGFMPIQGHIKGTDFAVISRKGNLYIERESCIAVYSCNPCTDKLLIDVLPSLKNSSQIIVLLM